VREAVIVSAVRTPLGKAPRGVLKDIRPDDLAAMVVRAALGRVPAIEPSRVGDVIMGCGVPEGEQGLNIGRLAAIGAGLPDSVPGLTVNRYCSSGLQTVAMAAQEIQTGMADVVVAGGVESMSRVPMLGYRPSPNAAWAEIHPDLYISMGHTAEEVARRYGVTRQDQDAFALRSHERAAAAADGGRFEDEIVPVPLPAGGAAERDEGIRRDTSLDALAQLRPVFSRDGTVTAGNAPGLDAGAAALVLMSRQKALSLGIPVLGTIVATASVARQPRYIASAPADAIDRVLGRAGLGLDDLKLLEINEAFAAVPLVSSKILADRHYGGDRKRLEALREKLNVNGGAVAVGHPVGASGARILMTLAYELRRRGGGYGACAICGGLAQADAAVIRCEGN